MDKSASLQDQDEVWLTKLAMIGVTVDRFETYWFAYNDGEYRRCLCVGPDLARLAKEVISQRTLLKERGIV